MQGRTIHVCRDFCVLHVLLGPDTRFKLLDASQMPAHMRPKMERVTVFSGRRGVAASQMRL